MANQKNPNQPGQNKPDINPDTDRQRQGMPHQKEPGRGDEGGREPMGQPGQPRRDQGKVISNPDEVEEAGIDDEDRETQRNPRQDQTKPMKP